MVTVIDADGLLLGRMASVVAGRALAGEEIAIVNAEKAIVSGDRAYVLADYYRKRNRGSREGGPFYPRRPDHIIKRTIRGMLPYKRERGIAAFKRIKVYVGVPVEFSAMERESLEVAHIDRLSNPRYVTVGAISTNLGAKY
ncbi:MAG: 50S ribosomal protein L13 [Methanoculleus bourgensis]|jgi:large subunit ribosomal protein L13|uniref:Large ribosomal subunit protein uL13 n=1 Tax=Methanoculleus bourgensis TaxID=83986 RepID=A0A0X3BJ27_9EURY|nr:MULTISPECIES: 50S ribosomal protein L13 [Methanoculleus]MDD3373662.1 50S ribosomal protein L13 [Methanoculleus bourgensis]NMA87861.1 50S ribosomal protein L13 [Methanoculleus bourgensis]CVK31961.1 50S ribosomal protein L13P [Methanoculleus bourgensis]SAI87732.1 50S ribosomal protein L13P [Methanoculleus bourgensis]